MCCHFTDFRIFGCYMTKMSVQEFLDLFIRELEINPGLQSYYRLLNKKRRFLWRKAYLEQRLEYIHSHLGRHQGIVWDIGCGYATTAIFLVLNGYKVYGNTLEFYYDTVSRRLDYWSRFGDLSNLIVEYADLYDMPVPQNYFDAIVAQDTLHHLEPIVKAAGMIQGALKQGGRLVVAEENGNSVFICMKNFLKRGFNRTSEHFDKRLGKTVLMGNENARGANRWIKIFQQAGLSADKADVEHIRLFPPSIYSESNYRKRIQQERGFIRKSRKIMNYLTFGINFTLIKPD